MISSFRFVLISFRKENFQYLDCIIILNFNEIYYVFEIVDYLYYNLCYYFSVMKNVFIYMYVYILGKSFFDER